MRKFMSLIENAFDDSAEMDRRTKIEGLIRYAFDKVGLTIHYNSYSIHHDDASHEVEVMLEDQEVALDQLNRLIGTGLSDSGYKVVWSSDALSIRFKTADALDYAEIPHD